MQINSSIQVHRAAMQEHRRIMLEQIEGIMSHLNNKGHAINRRTSQDSVSPPGEVRMHASPQERHASERGDSPP